jgi:hypothetical protein
MISKLVRLPGGRGAVNLTEGGSEPKIYSKVFITMQIYKTICAFIWEKWKACEIGNKNHPIFIARKKIKSNAH